MKIAKTGSGAACRKEGRWMFAWAITNIIIIGCFTWLAIFFEKWWIVLFAVLFTFEYRKKPH